MSAQVAIVGLGPRLGRLRDLPGTHTHLKDAAGFAWRFHSELQNEVRGDLPIS